MALSVAGPGGQLEHLRMPAGGTSLETTNPPGLSRGVLTLRPSGTTDQFHQLGE